VTEEKRQQKRKKDLEADQKRFDGFVKAYAEAFPDDAKQRGMVVFPADMQKALAASMVFPVLDKVFYLIEVLPPLIWNAMGYGQSGDPTPNMVDGMIENPHTRRLVNLLKPKTNDRKKEAVPVGPIPVDPAPLPMTLLGLSTMWGRGLGG
jgi:hypothetical protein